MKNKKIAYNVLDTHFDNEIKRGVYFIFDKDSNLIYIGESGATRRSSDSKWGLKDRLKQHISENDSGRQDFNVSAETVRNEYYFSYIELADNKDISNLEAHFINMYKPKFNNQHK